MGFLQVHVDPERELHQLFGRGLFLHPHLLRQSRQIRPCRVRVPVPQQLRDHVPLHCKYTCTERSSLILPLTQENKSPFTRNMMNWNIAPYWKYKAFWILFWLDCIFDTMINFVNLGNLHIQIFWPFTRFYLCYSLLTFDLWQAVFLSQYKLC